MTAPIFTLINKHGETIDLVIAPSLAIGSIYSLPTYRPRLKTSERLSSANINVSGDEEPMKRDISFEWVTSFAQDGTSSQATDYNAPREYLNNFIKFFHNSNEPFYLNDTVRQRRANVKLLEIKPTPVKKGVGELVMEFKLKLLLVDGGFESLTEIIPTGLDLQGLNFQSGAVTVNVVNEGSQLAYPKIEMSLTSGTTQVPTQILVFNVTNSSGFFLNDPTGIFQTNTNGLYLSLHIDSQTGFMYSIDGNSRIDRAYLLNDGGFLFMDLGSNEIRIAGIVGGSLDFIYSYRERYAY